MIQKAEKIDIASVTKSYIELFSYESKHGSYTNWISGLYPSERTAQRAFQDESLYVLKENGLFCGSMILNHIQPTEYQTIYWHYPAKPSEVLVLHTLCIPPFQKGKGYGKQFLNFAMQYASRTGCKVLRLDTWEGNRPAASLYEKMGFRLAGTAPMLLQGAIQEQQIFYERKV